uniref:Uncharacterized protein n=1 Tax=Cyanoderma ruficeps TaxID=181631 RepID=A0A8C3NRD5_9PASS
MRRWSQGAVGATVGTERGVRGHLVPLIGFISVGLGSAVLYLLRLALYSPDVRYGLRCPGHPQDTPQGLPPHPQSTGGSAQLW